MRNFLNVLKTFSNDVKNLTRDEAGVVSFEYVIVAACIVVAVAAAFGTGGTGPIVNALSGAISSIAGKVTSALT